MVVEKVAMLTVIWFGPSDSIERIDSPSVPRLPARTIMILLEVSIRPIPSP